MSELPQKSYVILEEEPDIDVGLATKVREGNPQRVLGKSRGDGG